MPKLHILIGSTRQGRVGGKIGRWLQALAQAKGYDAELIDLRDWPLPFYDEAVSPKDNKGQYSVEIGTKWAAKVAEADGYLILAAEYNHGYTAVLKNALDYCFHQWNHKPVAFASYGGIAAGTRAVQQLRQVAVELMMHPLREGVHMPFVWNALDEAGAPKDPHAAASAEKVLAQLSDAAEKLKVFRS